MRQVLLYRDEDRYWIAECPSLQGCVSQGETKEIALINIKEAIDGYIKALGCGSFEGTRLGCQENFWILKLRSMISIKFLLLMKLPILLKIITCF